MSFHSYRVVFSAPILTGPRTPDFGSCSMPLNCTGKVFGVPRPCLSPYRDERQMNLSYMVLLDMWNMFGKKIPLFDRWLVGWAGATEPPTHNKSMRK